MTIVDYNEDSEDEIPLALKFQKRATAGTSFSKSVDANDKRLSESKLQQNGIIANDSKLIKSPKISNKRSKGEDEVTHQSSAKKPKLLVTSANNRVKQASVNLELKTDGDEDYIPIAQRMKNSSSSNNKSASLKKKKKVGSSPSKKCKKLAKSSKYSKSTKVPPTSGKGRKWTTLVHNGVIFPPPYKPHGVKMLYDGNPVELTPEQEEVSFVNN